jgi:hypothetical protein
MSIVLAALKHVFRAWEQELKFSSKGFKFVFQAWPAGRQRCFGRVFPPRGVFLHVSSVISWLETAFFGSFLLRCRPSLARISSEGWRKMR